MAALFIAVLTGCAGSDSSSSSQAEANTIESPFGKQETERTPDILLVVVDTLRRNNLGYHGHGPSRTPNIDRLAADSARYMNAFSQSPWTLPSMASLLTSRSPSALRIHDLADGLGGDTSPLQARLREVGYSTVGVVSNRFLGDRWGLSRGFDEFDNTPTYDALASSRVAVDRSIDLLNARTTDRPFFLMLHVFDPHFSYETHDGFDFTASLDVAGPLHPLLDGKKSVRGLTDLLTRRAEFGADDLRWIEAIYDSEVAFVDQQLGRLLDHLRSGGIYDNMLIVFTADHGEALMDHDWIGHEENLYQELIGVPLLIKLPGQTAGREITEPVALIDVVPTILDFLGLDPPPRAEGYSLLPETDATVREGRRIYFETSSRGLRLRGVLEGDHKLIWDRTGPSFQLYDLADDPEELTDLAEERPLDVQRLRLQIESWLASVESGAPEAESVDLSDEELEKLRGLGYVH